MSKAVVCSDLSCIDGRSDVTFVRTEIVRSETVRSERHDQVAPFGPELWSACIGLVHHGKRAARCCSCSRSGAAGT